MSKPKVRRAKALSHPSGAEKTKAWREANVADGFCQNGKEHAQPTHGKLCAACLEMNYAMRDVSKARLKGIDA
jgi:hypothetical protein